MRQTMQIGHACMLLAGAHGCQREFVGCLIINLSVLAETWVTGSQGAENPQTEWLNEINRR